MSEIANSASLMQEAIEQIEERFVIEMEEENLLGSVEFLVIKAEGSSVRSLRVFTEVYFRKWFFFRKHYLSQRYVLRLTHVSMSRKFSMFNEGILKCELFLNNPRLLTVVQSILEPLKDTPWFNHGVEYVDMSDSPLALYPRERQSGLPKARLLVR